jgi:hypothetical protein
LLVEDTVISQEIIFPAGSIVDNLQFPLSLDSTPKGMPEGGRLFGVVWP